VGPPEPHEDETEPPHPQVTTDELLVPNHVRADLAVTVAVLERHGPVVAEALGSLTR
jgi:hypothetical protein